MRATLKRKRRQPERLITRIVNINEGCVAVHTFDMQVSLSSNGHEKTKETSEFNFKKVNRDPENTIYLNKMKIEFEILLYLRSLF